MTGRWEEMAQAPLGKPEESADVAIVGAGPAGLSAAAELARIAPGVKLVVLERESAPGGIPRHSFHQGYGLRDLHRTLSGPVYARELTEQALLAGADLRLRTQVTGWSDDGALELTSPAGVTRLYARAVVLTTGCRERPRAARLRAGSRPAGVMTTGTLQQLVYLQGKRLGPRAVVVGAEHVSYSAVATLAHAGVETVTMVTSHPTHQSYAAFHWGAQARYAVPLLTDSAVSEIHGRGRLTAVTVMNLKTTEQRRIECDTLVFTAEWIPDHELAVTAGLTLAHGTRGPLVDGALRTARAGLFAAGNVLHGAETADIAALSGHHVAASVADFLGGERWPSRLIPLECAWPLRWISPGGVEVPAAAPAARGGDWPAKPPRNQHLLRAHRQLRDVQLAISQDGRVLASPRLLRVMPGRSVALRGGWARSVDPDGGPVNIRVTRARTH